MRDVDAAAARPDRRLHILLRKVRPHLVLQRAQIADDHLEEVVEVVGQATGQLPDGGHLLRIAESRLGLLGGRDVEREHEQAQHPPVIGQLGNEDVVGGQRVAAGERIRVLERLRRPGEGRRQMRLEPFVEAEDLVGRAGEQLGEAAVGEADRGVLVDVRDGGRDRIGDETQPLFTLPQILVRGAQLRRAPSDPRLELLAVLPDEHLRAATLGDVGVDGDKTALGQRHALHRDDHPVGAGPFQVMANERSRRPNSLRHQGLDGAGPVFASRGVEADELLERGADANHLGWEVHQLDEPTIPADEPEIPIDDADALVDVIEPGLQPRALRTADRCALHCDHPLLTPVRAHTLAKDVVAIQEACNSSSQSDHIFDTTFRYLLGTTLLLRIGGTP